MIRIVSLFSGAGGLDLGFKKAGFKTVFANEYDRTIYPTFNFNFPKVHLDTRSIVEVDANDIPDVDGFIGGPPCQSWSEAGAHRGINDARGQLFHDYIRLIEVKKPKFFLAENVSGILHKNHNEAFENIINMFSNAGYNVQFKLLNAVDYDVPQDRKRVIIIGIRSDINKEFIYPKSLDKKNTLKDAIYDIVRDAIPSLEKNRTNPEVIIPNHEYMTGSFSTIFMSRNRVRSWTEPSFTIQAGGRHAPIHPQAPKMIKIETNKFIFKNGYEDKYRRLTVRECARVQTFPDNFKFIYKSLSDGYKMIGNAVPVNFAYHLAKAIKKQFFN